MRTIRLALFAGLAGLVVLTATVAQPPGKSDPKLVLQDTATRQAQLGRAFESFRQRLAVVAGRLENGSDKDKAQAKSLKKALKLISDQGTTGRFDVLIRELRQKNSDQNLDVLGKIVRENKELREDLQKILALILEDDPAKKLAEKKKKAEALLAMLKEVRNRQARLQAATEQDRQPEDKLGKAQEKLARDTKDVIDPENDEERKERDAQLVEKIRMPVEKALGEQGKAGKQLAGKQRAGAADSQGKAVGYLDQAIKDLEEELRQIRQEERQRMLADLLARCKRMLQMQLAVNDGTTAVERDVQKAGGKPTLDHAARTNRLADDELAVLRECQATLKIVQTEGSAAAFAEVFEQLSQDLDTIHDRLARGDSGGVTQNIENDAVETLKDIIKALEKATQEPSEPTPGMPGENGPDKKRPLVTLLQQLKMIFGMQRRINDRTTLYGKQYKGEQAPAPEQAAPAERQHVAAVAKELKDLSKRQDKLAGVTREVSRQANRPIE